MSSEPIVPEKTPATHTIHAEKLSKRPETFTKHHYIYLAILIILFGLLWIWWDDMYQNCLQNAKIDDLNKKYDGLLDRRELLQKSGLTRRPPGAIIIGARKAGTRALLEFLKLHPNVRTARYEVHYFNNNETYEKGLDWYLSKMPLSRPGQLTVEKTPGYFTSELAPQRVFQLNSSMKLVLIVRNPVIRAISDYTQVHYTKMSKNKTHRPFSELIFTKDGGLNLDYKPLRNSLYSLHYRRWLEYFPQRNIHIVDGDLLIKDPIPELRKLEHFLDLPSQIQEKQLFFSPAKGFFCFQPQPKREPKCLGDSKGRPHVDVELSVKQRLRTMLDPFNVDFYKLIGREFKW